MKVKILTVCALLVVALIVPGCQEKCATVGAGLIFPAPPSGPGIKTFSIPTRCQGFSERYASLRDSTLRTSRVGNSGVITPIPDVDGRCPTDARITYNSEDNDPLLLIQEIPISQCSAPVSLPLNWYCQDAALGHLIGRSDQGGWSATVGWDAAGWLQYGPYTTTVPTGANAAVWSLMIDNNSADNNAILTLDVNDATTQTSLTSMQVTRQQWVSTNTYQPFSLPFTVDQSRAGHMFEFRVYWLGQAYVKEQGCGLMHLDWTGADLSLGHQVGREDWYYSSGWNAWSAGPGWGDTNGWLQYGAYTNWVPVGNNLAIWNFLIDDNTSDDSPILYLDVNDATTQTILAMGQLTRTDWLYANAYQTFALPFTVDSSRASHTFEFRAYTYGSAYVNEQAVGFTPAE